MLLNHMGRDRALQGIQAFIKTYHGNRRSPRAPGLSSRSMRAFAPDPAAFDEFTRQWFFEVVLPEYRLHEPRKTREGEALEGDRPARERRNGNHARRGRRRSAASGSTSRARPLRDYREARATATLGKGESQELTIFCPVRARIDRRRSRRAGAPAPAEVRDREVLSWLRRTSRTTTCPACSARVSCIGMVNVVPSYVS